MTGVMLAQLFSRVSAFVSLALCFCLCPSQPWAKRSISTIGSNLRAAPLVVIADIQPTGAHGLDILLTFREVLKGDPRKVGQTDTLSLDLQT